MQENEVIVKEQVGEEIVTEGSFEELTQEKLAEQFNAAAEGEEVNIPGETSSKNTETEENKSLFNEEESEVYKEILGSEIPEEVFKDDKGESLPKKEVIKRINNMVAKKAQSKLLDDPFISQYVIERSKDGFNRADYIKNLTKANTVQNMDSKSFLEQYLKDRKYEESEIKKFIESKSKIELDELAEGKKKEYLESQNKENTKSYQEFIQRRTQELDVFNNKIGSFIDEYKTKVLSANKFPFKLAESDIEKVTSKMKELSRVGFVKVDGRQFEASPLDARLNDNKFLLKVLPYIALEELGMLDKSIHQTFNKIKDREFEKIDGTNPLGIGGDSSKGTNWSKFMGNS